eukprot:385274-Amphidinium_carterae.1
MQVIGEHTRRTAGKFAEEKSEAALAWRQQSEAWLKARTAGAEQGKQRAKTTLQKRPREATLEQLRCLNSALWN